MKQLPIILALATGLIGLTTAAWPVNVNVTIPQVCTSGCRILDVTRYGARPDDGQDDSTAINALLEREHKGVILDFPPGQYDFSHAIRQDHLDNVLFQGHPGSELVKASGFRDEYLLYTRFGKNVGIQGLTFRGLTRDRQKYRWGESGVYLASCNGASVIGNHFYDFGDAAIRITSSMAGPRGVASANSVVRDNYFENVSQITTTSNQNNFGGTAGYLLENNDFRNLKGSVKFATRTPGAQQVIIRNNRIQGVPSIPTSIGIEVVSYSDVLIEGNQINDCGGFGMNIYSNQAPGITGFGWGDYMIRNNTISGCAKGIRVSANAYRDGFAPSVNNINILENHIRVAAPKPIQLLNGTFTNSSVLKNTSD